MKNILFKTVILASAIFATSNIEAQSALDVLRLSDQTLIGTGRAAGTNTNMSGIGADFTTLSSNPAGIAQYRKSEIMLSPTVTNAQTQSTLLNGSIGPVVKDNKTKFRMPNLGLVIAAERNSKLSYAFGFGINGYNGDVRNFQFKGKSPGSITERFAAYADNHAYGTDPFESDLADVAGVFWTERDESGNEILDENGSPYYITDPDGSLVYDYKDYRESNTELDKYQSVVSSGVNLTNRLLLGATIGVPMYRYNETKIYQEKDLSKSVDFFEELRFTETKAQTGVGINAKFGAIFKPINNLTFGAAIQSPSFITITDEFDTELFYSFDYNNIIISNSVIPENGGTIDYTVTTPMKLQGSIGGILGKFGFVNAEVEYQNYSKSKIKIDSDNFFDKEIENNINGQIKANYKGALKINFGAEIAAVENFRFRAGIGVAQSPYIDQKEFLPNFGFGVGYRNDYFFLDLAYRQWRSENGYEPYYITEAAETLVSQKLTQSAFVLTIGFKL